MPSSKCCWYMLIQVSFFSVILQKNLNWLFLAFTNTKYQCSEKNCIYFTGMYFGYLFLNMYMSLLCPLSTFTCLKSGPDWNICASYIVTSTLKGVEFCHRLNCVCWHSEGEGSFPLVFLLLWYFYYYRQIRFEVFNIVKYGIWWGNIFNISQFIQKCT